LYCSHIISSVLPPETKRTAMRLRPWQREPRKPF
jgi:hypothetical protein